MCGINIKCIVNYACLHLITLLDITKPSLGHMDMHNNNLVLMCLIFSQLSNFILIYLFYHLKSLFVKVGDVDTFYLTVC